MSTRNTPTETRRWANPTSRTPRYSWIAVPGLLAFTVAVLVAAALRIRKMEIAYGVD